MFLLLYSRKDGVRVYSLNPPVPEWFSRLGEPTRARIAAEKTITDEARYTAVMMADPGRSVRRAAVRRISDQDVLLQAARDPKAVVRTEAARKLTDQETLFSLLFNDTSEDVRLAAGEALSDDALCFRAAMAHPDFRIRLAAVKKMRDPQLLRRIMENTDDRQVRLEAAAAIRDPELARELVRSMEPDHEDFATPRVMLVYAVTDQALLADLALNDPDYKARRAAASRLEDQDLLMRIIRDETEYDRVRAAAAGQITDQAVLRELADTYYHKLAPYDIGEEALKHIEDQAYLKETAEDAGLMHCLRKAAAEHVTDQEILFDWAMNADNDTLHDIGLAGIAFRGLTVPEYVAKAAVARADTDDLSERAVERLHDDRWLLWVILELGKREDARTRYWVRDIIRAAVNNVQDVSLLVEPALAECNDEEDILESMELSCIGCIAENPAAMRDYARRFTNPDAWTHVEDATLNIPGLEGLLENPLTNEIRRERILKMIGCLSRLDEIGMAD